MSEQVKRHEPGKLSAKNLADPEYVQAYIDELFSFIDEFVISARWSAESPTKAGWYWWRRFDNAPKHILKVNDDLSVDGITGSADHVDEIGPGGEWAGPLPEPTEQKHT